MTIIPIIINGKFLMIAAPKKQIKNSKHISAYTLFLHAAPLICVSPSGSPVPYDKLL